MSKQYFINSIFNSIQGEGFHSGKKSIFVRFSGCNGEGNKDFNCYGYCDTNYGNNEVFDIDQLMREIKTRQAATNINHIVLTGGEPILQIDFDLLCRLTYNDFTIQIETNGTLPLLFLKDIYRKSDVWITCSPKLKEIQDIDLIDEIKLIYNDEEFCKRIIEKYKDKIYFYIQPCEKDGRMNTGKTIKFIMNHKKDIRFSPQIHKLCNFK